VPAGEWRIILLADRRTGEEITGTLLQTGKHQLAASIN
jgi:hypothetical protein